ncbi:hypothetical protein F442_15103 [Phytophthora nicotianae P10297]|uniref:Uncharacterized protein n=1 Tax=Phytophthora nicotianae P10297 TaxID=1317064 RepID=W2YQ11_PHYNI|nr:hypothetical protein F442_15103 [Phytophthora nicotianae P10297]
MQMPGPLALSSFAAAWHASSLRDAMYTFAPFCTNPSAIILPMPRPPPVTITTLSLTLKSSAAFKELIVSSVLIRGQIAISVSRDRRIFRYVIGQMHKTLN